MAMRLLLASAAVAALACGKYGPPVRSDQQDAPAQSETPQSEPSDQSDEATP
jgi:hypothetical protein